MIRNMTLGTILVLWGAAASAQSSVTIYGLLDIGVAHGAGSGAGATSRTQLSSGNTQESGQQNILSQLQSPPSGWQRRRLW